MLVKSFVNGSWIKYEYFSGEAVIPLRNDFPVLVACDPSKSGYGVKVGDIYNNNFSLFEMIGKGLDTDEFCNEFTEYLQKYLKDLNIIKVVCEKMILKKGLEYYHSSEVLHEIRVHTKSVFKTLIGSVPEEINNQSWKASILPEGFRSREEKGSLRYLKSIDYAIYSEVSHNITDAVCIWQYVWNRDYKNLKLKCDCDEVAKNRFSIKIIPVTDIIPPISESSYNERFSLFSNCIYISNRLRKSFFVVNPNVLSLVDIYAFSSNFTKLENEVCILVERS